MRGSLVRPLLLACIVALGFSTQSAVAQPIKIGMGMSQTGGLAGGGKAALLAFQMWAEDVNAKGGLLGRKVELITYDDQSNPANSPGIYSKLLDLDKVDLLFGPYATVPTAPIMPMIKQRDLLLMSNYTFGLNTELKHDKFFNNAPWNSANAGIGAETMTGGFFEIAKAAGTKTIAFLAADQEFAQHLARGGKEMAKKLGWKSVYEQTYPPATTDFSAMIRAIRSSKPDAVFVASYPNDSVAILRAVNEIGVGDSVKVFGGGMVGLQFTPIWTSLGPLLNGVVNYTGWAPEKTMEFPGIKDFLARYSKRAVEAKVDPLGFYLPPYSYAIGQMIEQAVTETKSLDQKVLAKYLHTHELKTIVGPIRFNEFGERANPATPTVQFRGVSGNDFAQFRESGKQVILHPVQYKTGEAIVPFSKARQ
jgi:branched-chain amino acid transport system substrate-binding protein